MQKHTHKRSRPHKSITEKEKSRFFLQTGRNGFLGKREKTRCF